VHFEMESRKKRVQNLVKRHNFGWDLVSYALAKLKCDFVIYIIKSHKI
jgi:hypothetical protein